MRCKRCNGTDFQRDDDTGNSFCCRCGTLQEYDNYEAQLGGVRGPQGTYIRVGTTGTGSTLAYREKKIYEAGNLIEDIAERLQLGEKSEEIKRMIGKITDGEFGKGEWFSLLIGACCYALVRREGRGGVLTMDEISGVVGCDLHQLGSMCKRVVEYLGLELEEIDLVGLFVKTARGSPRLGGVDGKKKERVMKQGGFLMNCSLKWFLSTGRRPMPLVVAVLGLVCQVNGVKVGIDDLARDAEVSLCTCKMRYKELLEKLVKVAKEIGLPWAGDVTVKNVVKHSGTLIGLMEAKSMRKKREGKGDEMVISDGVCLEDIVRDCLSKEAMYCYDDGEGQRSSFLQMVSCEDWWKGKSKMSQRLTLKEVLEKDVGLDDDLPISYVKGCDAVERRREKIKAAKLRIDAIQDPCDDDKVSGSDELSLELVEDSKKKKRKRGCEIDWEDLVIQTLVLHDVKDEEIEKGHYNALLALHVFNCNNN
ncbi:zinc ion binding [Raphanus sativus]|uniref:Plant-specific TFIIB-related protein PTF2 n=1 Tax=Raphanus sativus TaxID=3726 RepID=A0A6J0MHP3_RAPSA|nr:plant-specific TFIIB-related protein PTF2 [Raphanus sativus]XP_056859700.1 plant-specific TFIIB-related protein PTF2-like [Raphanus sativus]KAJ4867514.1 zinc ion binding [Raphanus sativus]KAJ4913997.1 zinc ion binding [Raphanus sativus]